MVVYFPRAAAKTVGSNEGTLPWTHGRPVVSPTRARAASSQTRSARRRLNSAVFKSSSKALLVSVPKSSAVPALSLVGDKAVIPYLSRAARRVENIFSSESMFGPPITAPSNDASRAYLAVSKQSRETPSSFKTRTRMRGVGAPTIFSLTRHSRFLTPGDCWYPSYVAFIPPEPPGDRTYDSETPPGTHPVGVKVFDFGL